MQFLQELSLELNSNTAYTTIGAKQGDGNSRVIKIHITENGLDWSIPQNVQVSYRIRKPDGYATWNSATVDLTENVVFITLTSQDLAAAGRAYADIVFSVGTGEQRQILSTVSFILIIMAAPNIAEEIVSSNEFGEILDLTENAKIILNEGEAWAIGTKSGVPVLADSFSYKTVGVTYGDCTIDTQVFREYVGTFPGYTIQYVFTYIEGPSADHPDGIWQVAYNNELLYDIDLSNYGITLSGTWNQSNSIIVQVTDSDQQYHNNAKFWSDSTYNAKESIENLDASIEIIDEDAEATVDKTTINDVSISSQPDTWDLTVDEEAFVFRVGEIIGDYTFYYTNSNWTVAGATVLLTDYGISGAPTRPSEGDTFTIHFNTHKRFEFNVPRGRTGNVNFMTFEIKPEDGYMYMYRPLEVPDQITFDICEDLNSVDNGKLRVVIETEVLNNG